MMLICAVILTIAAVSMTPSSEQWEQNAMDRFAHVYKGSPPDHCVCDQALRQLPNGEFAIVFMTGGVHEPRRENYIAMWISDDDMQTWSYKRILTNFPGKLQYPDGFVDEEEGYVHFAFDYNRHDLIYVGAKLPD